MELAPLLGCSQLANATGPGPHCSCRGEKSTEGPPSTPGHAVGRWPSLTAFPRCARAACQLTCAAGKANKDCSGCTCPDHTLLGTVVSAEGSALANARVALQDRPQATLARTDQRGRFRVPGVCAGSAANVTVQLERFSPGAAPVIASGPQTSTVQVTLRRLGEGPTWHRGAGRCSFHHGG